MKHKRQLRWLLFLLVPFNILFTIHILTPLQFISNNGSMLQYYAGDEQMSLYRYTTTSYTTFSRRTLNTMFQKYIDTLSTINDLFWSKLTDSAYIDLKLPNTSRINAYEFSKQLNYSSLGKNSSINQSMWFSPSYKQQKQLPQNIKAIFDEYYRIDSYVGSLLFTNTDRLVHSFTCYVSVDNSSIFFQFPAQHEERFLDLNSQLADTYYTRTMGVYQANNQSVTIVPFMEYSDREKTNLLVFCTPRQTQNQARVLCLKLRANELQQQVRSNFSPLNFSQLNFTYYLLMNPDFITDNQKPSYIIFQQNEFYSKQQIDEASRKFINLVKIQPGKKYQTIQSYQFMYHYQLGFKVFFFSPINIDPFNRMATQYFIVCAIQLQESVLLNQDIAVNFPQILIPVTLLVIIASLLNSYVVKRILDNMQKQLYFLDQPCQYIVQGNLDVELPEYSGAKDIKYLYNQIKIINKLHRYSAPNYFSGHFSQKLLKYAQVLQFFKQLGYDTGNILQNMGQAYTNIEEWDRGREVLKQSIRLILQKIERSYGNIGQVTIMKKQKKMPLHYKQLQFILIRRLFKLNYNYLIYLDQGPSVMKDIQNKNVSQHIKDSKDLVLHKECLYYLRMLKKFCYPQFIGYAQCIMMLYYEVKQIVYLQNINYPRSSFSKIDRLLTLYNISYSENRRPANQLQTRQNLQKQKQNKKVHQLKQKPLSHYFRVHPDILKAFRNYFLYEIIQIQRRDVARYIPAVNTLCECFASKILPIGIHYMALLYIKNILQDLGIDTKPFQSTQTFRQMMPFSSFEYQAKSDITENKAYKFPTQYSAGLEREYVLIFDCGKNYVEKDQQLTKYQAQRVEHLHEKLIKPSDRISIIKFNSKLGVEIECKLLVKETSYALLKKSLTETVRERSSTGSTCLGVIESLIRAIERVKHLRSEKIIILFFRSVEQYKEKMYRIHRKHTEKYSSTRSSFKVEQQKEIELEEQYPEKLGEWIEYLLQDEHLKNLKLIFYCAKQDSREDLQRFFGLRDINRRIWSKTGDINTNNNLVYIIEQKYRSDIDRILMLKAKLMPDNHIFIF